MSNKIKLSPLEKAVSYQNRKVVDKFLEKVECTEGEALEIFIEMKKWVWLLAKLDFEGKREDYALPPPFYLLDEMWHIFILQTQDYIEYCEQYYGHYIHHTPFTEEEYRLTIESYKSDLKGYEEMLKGQYQYVLDAFDEKTLMNWYHIFPQKYYSHRPVITRIDPKMNTLRTINKK